MPLKDYLKFDEIEYAQAYERNELSRFELSSYGIFYLPTEVIISEPKIAVPVEGRIYRVDLFLKNGIIMTYGEISKIAGFKGTYSEEELMLVEIYEDGGEDGHIEYFLCGYALMTSKQIDAYFEKKKFKKASKNFWGK